MALILKFTRDRVGVESRKPSDADFKGLRAAGVVRQARTIYKNGSCLGRGVLNACDSKYLSSLAQQSSSIRNSKPKRIINLAGSA